MVLSLAVESGGRKISQLLIDGGLKVDVHHERLLKVAARHEDSYVLEYLLGEGADRTKPDEHGWTLEQILGANKVVEDVALATGDVADEGDHRTCQISPKEWSNSDKAKNLELGEDKLEVSRKNASSVGRFLPSAL